MKIRKYARHISIVVLLNLGFELGFPLASYALTGGPSQPEVQSFEPVGTTEMVDVFSGDFVYNIPLLDVEGFPINMSYHSGIGMDDEASWVGLGWNINVGTITRGLRDLPDDLAGDEVKRETNVLENQNWGVTFSTNAEFIGKDRKKRDYDSASRSVLFDGGKFSLGLSFGIFYNNYRGVGYEFSVTPSFASFDKGTEKFGLGLGYSVNSQSGLDIQPNISLGYRSGEGAEQKNRGFSFGARFNSREGLTDLTYNFSNIKKSKAVAERSSNSKKKYIAGFKGSNGANSSTISIGHSSFAPNLQNQFLNYSFNLAFRAGYEFKMFSGTYGISGYYQGQKLQNNQRNLRAYGYMYSDAGAGDDDALYDFNRSNDGLVTREKSYLPITSFSYDLFNVSGEGTGGMFRPHRGDVGVIHDPEVKSNTVGLGGAVELGGGDLVKVGIDVNGNYGFSRTGKWYKNDKGDRIDQDIHNFLGFKGITSGSVYEPVYFKSAGEKNVVDQDFNDQLADDAPVRIELDNNSIRPDPTNKLVTNDGVIKTFTKGFKRTKRDKRNQMISYLSTREARKHALDTMYMTHQINYFQVNSGTRTMKVHDEMQSASNHYIDRAAVSSSPDKLSEITVTNPDGGRYVYGIPAYNREQNDVVFNVINNDDPGSLSTDKSKGLVTYSSGDNTLGNTKGEDHYYQRNILPAYAHSFLLTGILSQDYIDVRGDGITSDDIGTAVKMNYTRVYTNYKWRTPHGGNTQRQANYNQGFKCDQYDDKGQYVYGEKEIWYLHSVESKNFVACFSISKRKDGCGVNSQDGGLDTISRYYKLDSIRLFTKQELLTNPTNPEPIKTVHFVYDYSLCKNIENSQTLLLPGDTNVGKLTLKKIFFTYGRSQKGKISPYQFTYNHNDNDYNPRYNMQGYDRWGNYKPNATNSEIDALTDPDEPLSNGDDPYVLQDKDSADKYAVSWHLTKIKIPSGGIIEVNYESDDYAYIQHKDAGQMFKVVGMNDELSWDTKNYLYQGLYEDNLYAFVDLNENIDKGISSDSLDAMKKLYFGGLEGNMLYYKFLVALTYTHSKRNDNGYVGEDYEYVSGYGEIEETGFLSKNPSSPDYDIAYVKFKGVPRNDNESPNETVHPIAKSAWYYLKMNFPRKRSKMLNGFEYKPGAGIGDVDFFRSLGAAFEETKAIWKGESRLMRSQNAGRNMVLKKSFIRLSNPVKCKYGGGSRVKQVTINDQWEDMALSGESAVYGQSYEYTTQVQHGRGQMTISSGIATYEPLIGNDENPWKQPISFTSKKALATDDRYFIETPLGEQFMPPASVGYSKVTVKNIKPSALIKRTGTGRTEHEFYTAKDFPVIFDQTERQFRAPELDKFTASLFERYSRKRSFASQGYAIVLNDMHGKPKSQAYFREDATEPYSRVSYHYKHGTHPKYAVNYLNNEVDVMSEAGAVTKKIVGKNIDVIIDSRQYEGYDFNFNGTGNVDAFLLAIFPAFVPSFWPDVSIQDKEMGMEVVTKVVYQFGLLEKTVVEEEGAKITTENLLYDEETGEVLLTRTQNEFADPIYNFTYPAHFGYESMGQAYKNTGLYFRNVTFEMGKINLANPDNYFEEGDECYVEQVTSSGEVVLAERIWYVRTNHNSAKNIFMTRSGHPVHLPFPEKTFNLKIIRSGRRNMQSIAIGGFTSLSNPLKVASPTTKNFSPDLDSIINTSAVEFSESWPARFNYVTARYVTPIDDSLYSFPFCDDPRKCNQDLYDLFVLRMSEYELTYPLRNFYNFYDAIFMYNGYNLYDTISQQSDFCGGYKCWPFDPNNDTVLYNVPSSLPPGAVSMAYNEPVKIETDDEKLFQNSEYWIEKYLLADNRAHGPSVVSLEVTYRSKRTNAACTTTKYVQTDACTIMQVTTVLCPDPPCTLGPGNTPVVTATGRYGRTVCMKRPLLDSVALLTYDYYCVCTKYSCYLGVEICNSTGCPAGGYDARIQGADTGCYTTYLDSFVNPYIQGMKGNWRTKRSWVFNDKRQQSNPTFARTDGRLLNYDEFWNKPAVSTNKWSIDSSKWTFSEVSRKFNKIGQESENQNALGISNAALYGYGESLPVAVSYNAKLRQTAFDGFEDYDYYISNIYDHFSFYSAPDKNVSAAQAHTGLNAMQVSSGDSVHVTQGIYYPELRTYNYADSSRAPLYFPKPTEYMGNFSPDTGKYLFSAWVKEDISTPSTGYTKDTARIIFDMVSGPDISFSFVPSGPVIEGWQRIEGTFTMPLNVNCYKVVLKAGDEVAWFDDVRMYPLKGRMKSFVYHPRTLRLMAELDENNYATFYEYDEEGRLVRIKRETERGIMTIQESRTGIKKTD